MTKGIVSIRSALRLGMLFVLALSGIVAAFATISPEPDRAALEAAKAAVLDPISIKADEVVLPSPASYVREATFRRGTTLTELFAQLHVSARDRQQLLRLRALRLLRPGDVVDAKVYADGGLLSLTFLPGSRSIVEVARDGRGFSVEARAATLSTRLVLKSGVISSSLFGAADAAGIPDRVVHEITKIFGSDIDFDHDVQRGDRFTVLYEMRYFKGRPERSGRVLAAEFVSPGKTYRALYYEGLNGRGGYYAPDGKSLQKAFLRAPLDYTRVSSGFGMRLDPYLKQWHMHEGVDFAAPLGTRVHASADGVVKFAGQERGFGNVIILRNWGPYSTLYAHLRRFAHGIRCGVRVKRGEIIGYVGETGWATGPHLHYEVIVDGHPRNPLTVALPSARPIPKPELTAFRRYARPLLAQLDLLNGVKLARLN